MKNVFWCKHCLNMSTRPRINFDIRGWCNACQWMEEKKILDWSKRERELQELLEIYKSKDGDFDCVVPISGGKDGSYISHTLKKKYGMNPLAISVMPPLALEVGNRNVSNFVESGFNLIHLRLNPIVMKALDKIGFINKGFPYYGWLIAIQSAVIRTAVKFKIGLIFYGEDGEVEYGGSTETKNHSLISLEYQKKVWFEAGYESVLNQLPVKLKKDAVFWRFPSDQEIEDVKLHTATWSYFEDWDPYRNYLVAKEFCGLQEMDITNQGTFTNFAQNDQALYALHCYLMYLKFGFGRALQDAGIEIRRGAMTRNQAINLVKLYDGHYPEEFLETYLKYYEMSQDQFDLVLDRWVNKELFVKENRRWEPTFEIE